MDAKSLLDAKPLLEIKNLKARFRTGLGWVNAVDGLSFSLYPGEITGLVGESGCGKSVTVQSILRLPEHTDPIEYAGEIIFENQNLLALPLREMRRIRGKKIAIVFQDPLSSLNPLYTLGAQIQEAFLSHIKSSSQEAKEKVIDLLRKAGLPDPEKRYYSYPHELSGGMRQRGMIASALVCSPKLLIADEPTTALDAAVQAQILDLIGNLSRKNTMAVLFISHDLGVIAKICSSVKVMYLGQIVEEASSPDIVQEPLHPYTQGLIKSIPPMTGNRKAKLYVIPGGLPSPGDALRGCRFAERCPDAGKRCAAEEPPLFQRPKRRRVKCWRYSEPISESFQDA
jgi:oligopeptide/dipeptide ABC transporter ATP-binding protein